jgi:hypothetical protein
MIECALACRLLSGRPLRSCASTWTLPPLAVRIMMSNRSANPESVARQRKSAMLRRLLQAAVLACVLVPLGTVALEGSIAYFSCNIENEFGCTGEGAQSYTFGFGDYYLALTFDMVAGGDIGVEVTPTVISQTAFESKADAFPGYQCLAITQAGQCVEFDVDPFMGSAGTDWTHYELEIHWNKIEDQVLDPLRMTMLVNRDALPNDGTTDYDYDVCLSGLYDPCDIDPDPGIRSGDTAFSQWIAAERPATGVPEPSTLLLLGAGVSAVGLRRRRRP